MIVLVFQKYVIYIIGQNIDTFYTFVVFFVILINSTFYVAHFPVSQFYVMVAELLSLPADSHLNGTLIKNQLHHCAQRLMGVGSDAKHFDPTLM